MTLEQKLKSLKAKRANILKRAQSETKKLEQEFRSHQPDSKVPLVEQIKSWGGRYYAKVGPMLKEAKFIQKTIELLR